MPIVPFITDTDVTAALPLAIAHLASHGIIAYPTETIYGLGSTTDPVGVARLAALKDRPAHKPFLILIHDAAQLTGVSAGPRLDGAAAALAARFWPGPLTLVLPGPRDRATGSTAVRATSHAGIRR